MVNGLKRVFVSHLNLRQPTAIYGFHVQVFVGPSVHKDPLDKKQAEVCGNSISNRHDYKMIFMFMVTVIK